MKLNRVGVKFPVRPETGTVDLEPFIGLFHDLIREQALPGLLIDVADYRHVPEGPGVIVIGHDVDFGIDLQGGRAGLLVLEKRCGESEAADSVRRAVARGLEAAVTIGERSGLSFGTDALEVLAFDRIVAANDVGAADALSRELTPVFRDLHGDVKHELSRTHADDPRKPLALLVRAPEALSPAELRGRLRLEAPAEAAAPAASGGPPQTEWDVSVEQLQALRSGAGEFRLIDVREQAEYDVCEIGGELIPLGTLAGRMDELDRSAHIVVHCKTGGRSAQAVKAMRKAGFENVWNVQGGILAWIDRIDPTLTRY